MNENELIDKINSLQAQNIALHLALESLVRIFPDDVRSTLKSHYDTRCALFQTSVTLGTTDQHTLQIQREQFQKTRDRLFSA